MVKRADCQNLFCKIFLSRIIEPVIGNDCGLILFQEPIRQLLSVIGYFIPPLLCWCQLLFFLSINTIKVDWLRIYHRSRTHLLILRRMRFHNLFALRCFHEVRPCTEFLYRIQQQIAVVISQTANFCFKEALNPLDKVNILTNATHCLNNQTVPVYHVQFQIGVELVRKALMPDADTVQGQKFCVVGNGKFYVIATDKQRHRQMAAVNLLDWNAAVPPSSIGICMEINIFIIFKDAIPAVHFHNPLIWAIRTIIVYIANVFVLQVHLFKVEHCTADIAFTILRLYQCQQRIGTDKAFRQNHNIIVHQQNMGCLEIFCTDGF